MNLLPVIVGALELPPNPGGREFWRRLVVMQLIYSLAGLFMGLACVIGGIALFFHGVAGSSSWVGQFIGVQGQLSDAAPGTVLFVVGLLVVWLTRFDVRLRAQKTVREEASDQHRKAG